MSQRIQLVPEMDIATHYECTGGVDGACRTDVAAHRFSDAGGTVEMWEDKRFTGALRKKLWGHGGIVMLGGPNDPATQTFYQRREKNAVIVLRSVSGRIVARLNLDRPLAEFRESLEVRPSVRTLVVAIDTSGPDGRSGVSGEFLDVDAVNGRLAIEQYTGPGIVKIHYPSGVTAPHLWTSRGDLTIPGNGKFEFRAAQTGQPSTIKSSACAINSYTDPRTGQYEFETGNDVISAQLRGGLWRESVRVDFHSCQDF